MPYPRFVAAAIVVALTATACSSSPSGAPSIAPPLDQPSSASSVTSSATSGELTSPAGPVAAAVTYVASTDELMAHSPVGRAEIFRKLLAPSAVEKQVTAFEQSAEDLATTLDVPVERLVWVEAPLTATLVDAQSGRASVDVWTVSILGAPDAGSPQQVWRTVRVDLQVTGDRWLVVEATADAGPTPAASELALQSGWDEFARVAGWAAVVEGVGL